MQELIPLGIPLVLLLLGLIAGRANEARHLVRLAQREEALRGLFVTDLRSYAPEVDRTGGAELVIGEAVIATDYLKTLLALLRNIFGGEVRAYTTLVMRARREALLRAMEQARERGYNALCNVRLETADIGGNAGGAKGVPLAAVIASATAYRLASPSGHPYRGQ